MENHPIPQDVTGFKFKLIGSVTVKQFLYLLGGGILALVCFILPTTYLIKLPLAAIFGGMGTLLAFVPIEGRPMDVMIKNFLKALPAENQYIFKKRGAEALVSEYFTPKPTYLQKTQDTPKQASNSLDTKRALLYSALRKSYKPDDQEQKTLATINSFLDESQHGASPQVQNVDRPPAPKATQIAQPTTTPPTNISEAIKVVIPTTTIPKETPVAKPSPTISTPDSKPVFENSNNQPLSMNAYEAKQAPQIPKQQVAESMPQTTPPQAAKPPAQGFAPNTTQNVTTVAADSTLKAGFPQLPDTPNVVLGIIKDPRGKILPNILVEIMDMQGIPVRAFKTNSLGQFAAATPLPDGDYNILLEDPRKQHEFEQIQIKLEGKIFEPLEIFSVDQREKLRRELFGGATAQA